MYTAGELVKYGGMAAVVLLHSSIQNNSATQHLLHPNGISDEQLAPRNKTMFSIIPCAAALSVQRSVPPPMHNIYLTTTC